jgi:hypothetical protein
MDRKRTDNWREQMKGFYMLLTQEEFDLLSQKARNRKMTKTEYFRFLLLQSNK